MGARSLSANVWKVWRQDSGARGQRLFWYVESYHPTVGEFMKALCSKGYMTVQTLTTERDDRDPTYLVVVDRREITLTPSAVHFAEVPINAHFVEYIDANNL